LDCLALVRRHVVKPCRWFRRLFNAGKTAEVTMKIGTRHEIAMWVLALLWARIALLDWLRATAGGAWGTIKTLSAIWILAFLVIFSLRERKKPI
jgi:hypothetical protein